MKSKLKVGIIFGGKSAEHEVSLQSAKNIYQAINKDKYDVVLIGIDKQGQWLLSNDSQLLIEQNNPRLTKLNLSNEVALVPQSNGKLVNVHTGQSHHAVDVVFPILHGPFGEDGTIQGLLKLANIPFVGAGVLGSAVGMDKDVMKRLLRDAHIPVAKFLSIKEKNIPSFAEVVKSLGLPFFVKPANLGSSVGINKVHTEQEYQAAIAEAFSFDKKVLIEEFIQGREIECSVLGNEDPIVSLPGEVISHHDFYSYDAKYIDKNGASLEIPAKISSPATKRIQELALQVFTVLECEDMARVDFFLKEDDTVLVNEINTIPGFTSISMYPKLWEASGIGYSELIDKLIQLALKRFAKNQKLRTCYID
ncbi:MAG: D-alanine--D-alanine ligase A [Gammaproteobacteria bacterium RIFCSPHIGHO2_12_FULL_35_23]|nr:MAG: D-alanine--D-alanine ligase A [Gammaproteobacteria bacterium RIFCSPHIGHO2_12_FULL_35_23]